MEQHNLLDTDRQYNRLIAARHAKEKGEEKSSSFSYLWEKRKGMKAEGIKAFAHSIVESLPQDRQYWEVYLIGRLTPYLEQMDKEYPVSKTE